MRHLCFIGLVLLLFSSCGLVKKRTTYAEGPTVSVAASETPAELQPAAAGEASLPAETAFDTPEDSAVNAVVATALSFSGVKYRYGGTTRKGMDCSGLLYVSFQENDFTLPRVSHEMAQEGHKVKVGQLQKGDLLFFRTTRRGGKINHVGLVVEVEGDDVRFIHSTTSRGVIVSSLREGFWNYAFVKATRVF